jgi:hypothetical protein
MLQISKVKGKWIRPQRSLRWWNPAPRPATNVLYVILDALSNISFVLTGTVNFVNLQSGNWRTYVVLLLWI